MTKLKRYATAARGRIADLARAADVSDAQMHRIVHGERGASLSVAVAIANATGGFITPSDVAAAKINTRKGKKRAASVARAGR